MLSSDKFNEWDLDLKAILFDLNVATNNLFILEHENSNKFRTHYPDVCLNLWYQQYFICIIQLAKLFSNSGQQKRNFSKLCKILLSEDLDVELTQKLLIKIGLNDVLKSKENLMLIVSEINLELQNKSAIIVKIISLRDKVYAHTDPETSEVNISTEELINLKDFAIKIYNNIFGNINDENFNIQFAFKCDFRSMIEEFMK